MKLDDSIICEQLFFKDSAQADSSGHFTDTLTMPNDMGDMTFWFRGASSGNTDTVVITIED